MSDYFPLFYLSALIGVLGAIGWFVWREIRRTRRQESVLTRLQGRLSKELGEPQEHYELGRVYLEKRLYQQAITQLKKGLEAGGSEIPPLHNALGFAYFCMGQYDLAIRHYKDAVKFDSAYVIAWNNLGHAFEKKNQMEAGLDAYDQALTIDPTNAVAKRRADSLRKRMSPTAAKDPAAPEATEVSPDSAPAQDPSLSQPAPATPSSGSQSDDT